MNTGDEEIEGCCNFVGVVIVGAGMCWVVYYEDFVTQGTVDTSAPVEGEIAYSVGLSPAARRENEPEGTDYYLFLVDYT